jgi:hypothetical protein
MAEAERLSMTDVVSIFTVQQLVQTTQLPATVDAVSRHVRSVFQLPLASPPAADEDAYNACTREVSASPNIHDVFLPISPEPAPVHVDYSPEVLRKALDDAEYDRGVDLLSEQNLQSASDVVMSWVNGSPQFSRKSPILEFICAVFRRGACDGSFVAIAVQVLSRLNRDVQNKVFDTIVNGSNQWFSYKPHGSALITQFMDAAVTWALRWIPSQSNCSPAEATGRVIYRYEEHWLSDAVFLLRLNNAAAFVLALLRAGVIRHSLVRAHLTDHGASPDTVYDRLVLFGPVLDVPGQKPHIDEMLDGYNRALSAPTTDVVTSRKNRIGLEVSLLPLHQVLF